MKKPNARWQCLGETAAALLLLVGISQPFEAAAKTTGPNETLVIMIAEQSSETESLPVIRAVEGQLSGFDATLKVIWVDELADDLPTQIANAERAALGFDAVAVFWCNLNHPDQIYLYFAAPRGGRVLVRQLTGTGSGGMAEALAIIVGSSVQAAIAGGEIGTVTAPTHTKKDDDKTAEDSQPNQQQTLITFGANAAAVVDILTLDQSPQAGILLGTTIAPGSWWSLSLGYIFFWPEEYRAKGLELQLRRHPAHLTFAGFTRLERFRLGGSLSLQIDFVSEQKTSLGQGASPEGDDMEVILSATPMLDASFALTEKIELFLGLGADIPFRNVRYTLSTGSGEIVLLRCLPARPRVIAGMTIKL